MKIVLALCYLATWAAIPHLLLLKKRPAATLAWLWAILFIPFLGALVYCLFGTDRLKRRWLKYRTLFSARPSRQRTPASATDEATAALIQKLPGRERQFLQLLSRINRFPSAPPRRCTSCAPRRNFIPRSSKGPSRRDITCISSSISGVAMKPAGGFCAC